MVFKTEPSQFLVNSVGQSHGLCFMNMDFATYSTLTYLELDIASLDSFILASTIESSPWSPSTVHSANCQGHGFFSARSPAHMKNVFKKSSRITYLGRTWHCQTVIHVCGTKLRMVAEDANHLPDLGPAPPGETIPKPVLCHMKTIVFPVVNTRCSSLYVYI